MTDPFTWFLTKQSYLYGNHDQSIEKELNILMYSRIITAREKDIIHDNYQRMVACTLTKIILVFYGLKSEIKLK